MDSTKLWYSRPAWQWDEALPLGNGSFGAMIFGGPLVDRIPLNEESLWSGGPQDRLNPAARENLDKIRSLIREGRMPEAHDLCSEVLIGTPEFTRHYEPLCDLVVQMREGVSDESMCPLRDLYKVPAEDIARMQGDKAQNYRRELDLMTGLHRVCYTIDGIEFEREAFVSFPAKVMAMRMKGVCARAMLRRGRLMGSYTMDMDDTVLMCGTMPSGGVTYCVGMKGVGEGTHRVADLIKTGRDCVLYVTAATTYNTEDPKAEVLRRLDKAAVRGYDALKEEHIADFRPFMERCSLNFPVDPELEKLPTDKRHDLIKAGQFDGGFYNRCFQMARYLMVSSSRPGTLPGNLQGIWNDQILPPWGCTIYCNINGEMNYWPAESCNLSEFCPCFSTWKTACTKRAIPSPAACTAQTAGYAIT